MGVVGRELRIEGDRLRNQQTHRGEIRHVRVQFAREHRIIFKTALLRPFDFAVPIRAFDEPYRNALTGLLGQPAKPANERNGALAVGLHGKTKTVPVVELRVDEHLAEHSGGDVEPILFLRVDGQPKALGPCSARERQKARREFGVEAMFLAGFETRMQRRQLHRDRRPLEDRVDVGRRERRRGVSDSVDGRHVALEVALGIALGARGFAQHVIGEAVAFFLETAGARQCRFNRRAEHELLAEQPDGLAHGEADRRLARARDEAFQRLQRIGALRLFELYDATRQHQAPGRGVDEQTVRLAEMLVPGAAGNLVGDERVRGFGVGNSEQRLGEAHQNDALVRR